MPVAFFDVDNTLLAGSTVRHSLAVFHRSGLIRWRDMLTAFRFGVAYKLGFVQEQRMFAAAVRVCAGHDIERVNEVVRQAWRDRIRHRFYPEGLALIAHHRARGHKVVLLSGTSTIILDWIARELGVDAAIGSEQRVGPTGKLLNAYRKPLCIGRGKVLLAREWLSREGLLGEVTYFYSDSITDLPMLEYVDIPVACNPDVRLRTRALLRDWPVLDFERRFR